MPEGQQSQISTLNCPRTHSGRGSLTIMLLYIMYKPCFIAAAAAAAAGPASEAANNTLCVHKHLHVVCLINTCGAGECNANGN